MQREPRKTKIINQFLLFMLPFVILAISVTSAVLMWNNYIHYKNTIAQDYQNIIKVSSGEIRLFMESARKNLEALAWVLSTGGQDPYAQKMALTAFNHVNSEFKHVSLISQQGRTIASTRWNDDSTFLLDEKLFQNAVADQSGFSEIRFTEEQFPYIVLTVPVPGFGKTRGLVWGVLDLKYVWDVLEGIAIGRTGHVYIMDVTGKYIAHRHIHQVLTASPQVSEDTLDQIRNTGAPVAWFEKIQDQTFYCLGLYIQSLDWIVTLHQSTEEIYYHFFQNLYWAGLITVLACITAIMFGFYRVKEVIKPIKIIHQQVQQIIAGNLNQKVTVASTDEIGELASAFNDMTESLKEKIDKEIQSARQLAHAEDLAVLGTSAGKVTHEVGNLLNNVGMAANALQAENLSPVGKEALTRIEKESARVKAFIQSFLQFAKPPELKLKPVALDLIMREVLAMHELMAQKQNITLSFEWPADAPQVSADSQLIYQAFNNLVKNGIEAMENSGTLKIAGAFKGEYLEVTVEDSGPGIAPEHLDRIFEPFFTTKGKKGTGLGMAIVKSTITAHRGTIACQSEPGRGTCFHIRLPLR